MNIILQPTARDAALLTARLLAKALRDRPALVLGLATGRTMEEVYAHLARMHRTEKLDFSLCHTFNLDEYAGLPADHPSSYRAYMEHHLFRHINIDPRNTYLPNGMAGDLNAEADRYDAKIRECGGIDVQLLGIGSNGHIGFNEPLSALRSRTRATALTPATRTQNAAMFDGKAQRVPARALTMGVGTILEARRCLLLATGPAKAEILAQAMEGPLTAMVTASALQLHPCCTVIADEAAGARLQNQTYYRWLFANDPEWADFRTVQKKRPVGRKQP